VRPRVFVTCPEHVAWSGCEDDDAYTVDTVAAARALHTARFGAGSTAAKQAYVVLSCEPCQGTRRLAVRVGSVAEARAAATRHDRAWYTRRVGGRVVDACQWHLGCCCIEHVRPWCLPYIDQAAILPGEAARPVGDQLDLFAMGL